MPAVFTARSTLGRNRSVDANRTELSEHFAVRTASSSRHANVRECRIGAPVNTRWAEVEAVSRRRSTCELWSPRRDHTSGAYSSRSGGESTERPDDVGTRDESRHARCPCRSADDRTSARSGARHAAPPRQYHSVCSSRTEV